VLSEVDRVCQRIGLVRGGRLVAVRSLTALRAAAPRRVTITFSDAISVTPPGAATVLVNEPYRWVLEVEGPIGPMIAAIASLPVADLDIATATLQDTVIRLMNEGSS
jgi:ABC-2 type transport system ATP-binding protein